MSAIVRFSSYSSSQFAAASAEIQYLEAHLDAPKGYEYQLLKSYLFAQQQLQKTYSYL